MNFHISSLSIYCKNGSVLIPFSNHINFFCGNTGVGKTTMINLINFALGQELIHTQVVDNSVLSVGVNAFVEGNRLIIERRIKSNIITVINNNHTFSFYAKGKGNRNKPTFSEFLYSLSGITPYEMVQGSGANRIRITFANYMWFSYLRQEELDNTLFYLEDKNGNMKYFSSRYVLNSLLDQTTLAKSDKQQEINLLRNKEDEIRSKLNVVKEITSQSAILNINLGTEIAKKKQILASFDRALSNKIKVYSNYEISNNNTIQELVETAKNIGEYETEIKYLKEFEKIKTVQKRYESLIKNYSIERNNCERQLEQISQIGFRKSLQELANIMKQILLEIEFPGFFPDDIVTISSATLVPSIFNVYGTFKYDYKTLSSSGIKTIFKICFALSIHCFENRNHIKSLLPSFLIIDTPMKNISERMDKRLYSNLYKCIYRLFSPEGELHEIQLIIIDKEKSDYFENKGVPCKLFTTENPLIPSTIA